MDIFETLQAYPPHKLNETQGLHDETLQYVLYFNQPINLEQSRTKHLAFAKRPATCSDNYSWREHKHIHIANLYLHRWPKVQNISHVMLEITVAVVQT